MMWNTKEYIRTIKDKMGKCMYNTRNLSPRGEERENKIIAMFKVEMDEIFLKRWRTLNHKFKKSNEAQIEQTETHTSENFKKLLKINIKRKNF